MIYRVTLHRAQSHEAAVELEAEDREEAERMAWERDQAGMVNWVQMMSDVSVEAVEQ